MSSLCASIADMESRSLVSAARHHPSHCAGLYPSNCQPKQTLPSLRCFYQVFGHRDEKSSYQTHHSHSHSQSSTCSSIHPGKHNRCPICSRQRSILLSSHLRDAFVSTFASEFKTRSHCIALTGLKLTL